MVNLADEPNEEIQVIRLVTVAAVWIFILAAYATASEFNRPWLLKNQALVLDAYELNSIDWNKIVKDRRIVGFINKATDGLAPKYNCSKGETEVSRRLCREQYRKYAITRELYKSRRLIALQKGLKWGAYHLGRPGDPIKQANHFIRYANPGPDDLIALDIEHIDSEKWISLKDAEIFATHIKTRLGRYPLLYLNGSTAKFIAENSKDYPILSRLPLWYARYKPNISGLFPLGNWQSYSLWQFAYKGNCNKKKCPYRVAGAPADIDVNVSKYTIKQLRKIWPFKADIQPDSDLAEAALEDEGAAKTATTNSIGMVDHMITGSIGNNIEIVNQAGFAHHQTVSDNGVIEAWVCGSDDQQEHAHIFQEHRAYYHRFGTAQFQSKRMNCQFSQP